MVRSDDTTRDTLVRLALSDWQQVVRQLLLYAELKVWRSRLMERHSALPQGIESADLAFSAILKLLTGARKWDPQRTSLIDFLKGVIDSELNHLTSSAERRSRSWLDEGSLANVRDPRTSPADDALFSDQLRLLREAVRDDPKLEELLPLLLEGEKPAQIADRLGTTVKDVYQLIRRLRRRIVRVRASLEEASHASASSG